VAESWRKLSQRGSIKDVREALSRHSASSELGSYRMEKHEGDTASEKVLE